MRLNLNAPMAWLVGVVFSVFLCSAAWTVDSVVTARKIKNLTDKGYIQQSSTDVYCTNNVRRATVIWVKKPNIGEIQV